MRSCSPRKRRRAPGTGDLHSARTRLGKLVIEAEGVSKAYGERLLIDKMSFALPPAGLSGYRSERRRKTTLFRMITGQEKPDSGTIRIAETVKLAYVDQSRDVLDRTRRSGR